MQLNAKSERNLVGVHADLVKVVRLVADRTAVPFVVWEGVRTVAREKALIKAGNSKISNPLSCRHVPTGTPALGHAADLVPLIGGQPSWAKWDPFFLLAVSIRSASIEAKVPIRWGGVWDRLIAELPDTQAGIKAASAEYCRRHPGSDFLDGPHIELPAKLYP